MEGEGEAEPRDPRLDDRVVELLRERSGALAFNGLRRSLGAHPESLVRALRRLERYGVVERSAAGYRIASDAPPEDPAGATPAPPRWKSVAEVELGSGLGREQVLGVLAGRWAGSLRWVGIYERPKEPLLVWSRTTGPGHLLLGVRGHRLRVYAELPEGDPGEPGLHAAARELLGFALEKLRPLPPTVGAPVAAAFWLGTARPSAAS